MVLIRDTLSGIRKELLLNECRSIQNGGKILKVDGADGYTTQ